MGALIGVVLFSGWRINLIGGTKHTDILFESDTQCSVQLMTLFIALSSNHNSLWMYLATVGPSLGTHCVVFVLVSVYKHGILQYSPVGVHLRSLHLVCL